MALTPQAFHTDLTVHKDVGMFPFSGPVFDKLAWAVATSVSSWAVLQGANVGLTGISSGTVGNGIVTSFRIVVPPNPGIVVNALVAAGLGGPLGVSLGTVVGTAIPKTFSTVGGYTGNSVGVGIGAETSRITISNPVTLVALLSFSLASFLGPGMAGPTMARGLGTGIASLLSAGIGSGTVTGLPGTTPGVGFTRSMVF